MNTATVPASTFQSTSASAFSAGTRTAGAVIALGYLLGFVPGPIVAVVGGLALMTYGRHLLTEGTAAAVSGIALAVIGGALGIASLRWGALDLSELRGVQSVLGPTVLVGPTEAAFATGLAAGSAVVALAVWLARPWPTTRTQVIWCIAEGAIASLAIVTVFLDPAQSALGSGGVGAALVEIGRWIAVVVAVTGVATAGAWGLHRFRDLWRAVALAVAGAAVVVAAGVLVSAV